MTTATSALQRRSGYHGPWRKCDTLIISCSRARRWVYTTLPWVVYLPAIALWLLAFIALTVGGALGRSLAIGRTCLRAGRSLPGRQCLVSALDNGNPRDRRRIVYKRGFIRRHTVEINMDKVEGVDVDQSILGRMLNYGDITIRGRKVQALNRCTISMRRSNSEIR